VNSDVHLKEFAVVGNPVAHSRSPAIHHHFGQQTGIALHYRIIESPLDAFTSVVRRFFEEGGSGLNVTVPFKQQAWELAHNHLSQRALLAGAVNTLWMKDGELHGCNTDGIGLLADLRRLGNDPAGKRILLVGAGGAARGVIFPLLEAGASRLHIVNRSPRKAVDLAGQMAEQLPDFAHQFSGGGLHEASGNWDIVMNATSSSLSGETPPLQGVQYAPEALAYDMVYAATPTPFMQAASAQGARIADGLGMLVAQAAASFAIWNGVQPDIEPVLPELRKQLLAS